MIADSFDRRTMANMEVALERACADLAAGEQHAARRRIAARIILECARKGDGPTGRIDPGRASRRVPR